MWNGKSLLSKIFIENMFPFIFSQDANILCEKSVCVTLQTCRESAFLAAKEIYFI